MNFYKSTKSVILLGLSGAELLKGLEALAFVIDVRSTCMISVLVVASIRMEIFPMVVEITHAMKLLSVETFGYCLDEDIAVI